MTAVLSDCLSCVMLLTLHNNVKMFFNQIFRMKITWCQNIFSSQSALLKNITELCVAMTTSLICYKTTPNLLAKKSSYKKIRWCNMPEHTKVLCDASPPWLAAPSACCTATACKNFSYPVGAQRILASASTRQRFSYELLTTK